MVENLEGAVGPAPEGEFMAAIDVVASGAVTDGVRVAAAGLDARKLDSAAAALAGAGIAPVPGLARQPDEARAAMASAQHELWRLPRRLEDGTFEARPKTTTDHEWVQGNPGAVRWEDGKPKVDIANLDFAALPKDWQQDNLEEAGNAIDAVLRYWRPGGTFRTSMLDSAAADIHAGWNRRTADWPDIDPALRRDYSDLDVSTKVKNWNIVRMALEHLGIEESPRLQSALAQRVRKAHGLGLQDTAERFRDPTRPADAWVGPFVEPRRHLHERYYWDALSQSSPPAADPHAVMLIGPPASGKTTMLAALRREGELPGDVATNHVAIDPDQAKSFIPEYADLRAVGDPKAGDFVHRESSLMSSQLQERALALGRNVIIQRSGRHASDAGELIMASANHGYKTHMLMADVPVDVAVARSAERAARIRRPFDPKVIESTAGQIARDGLLSLRSAGGIHEVRVIDTAGLPELREIARRTEGDLTVLDRQGLQAIAGRAGVDNLDGWLLATNDALAGWRGSPHRLLIDGDPIHGKRFLEMAEYRKEAIPVSRTVVDKPTPVKVSWQDEPLMAKPGDSILSDGQSEWPVAKDIFEDTYQPLADGRWVKVAGVQAMDMPRDFTVLTLEGQARAAARDYLVQGPKGEAWPIQRAKFGTYHLHVPDAAKN